MHEYGGHGGSLVPPYTRGSVSQCAIPASSSVAWPLTPRLFAYGVSVYLCTLAVASSLALQLAPCSAQPDCFVCSYYSCLLRSTTAVSPLKSLTNIPAEHLKHVRVNLNREISGSCWAREEDAASVYGYTGTP